MRNARPARPISTTLRRGACVLVPILLGVPPAAAEIFKCAGKNGTDLYQNFPCSIDSLGSLPSSALPANSTLRSADAGQAKPSAAPRAAASTGRSAGATEPRVGMTPDEVTAIWGEPEEMIQDEPRSGRVEIWRYADGRSVQFSNKHRVLTVRR
jgi:hypothetical protein